MQSAHTGKKHSVTNTPLRVRQVIAQVDARLIVVCYGTSTVLAVQLGPFAQDFSYALRNLQRQVQQGEHAHSNPLPSILRPAPASQSLRSVAL